MIKVAIIGYGNIGKAVYDAVMAAPDFTLAGIIDTRRNKTVPLPKEICGENIINDIDALEADVAILGVPSRNVVEYAQKCLLKGISTVDSYDIHGSIWEIKTELDTYAKKGGAVSVLAAGWDPGSDSVIRALFEVMSPKGITYTNFGPGMSMGHTVAVKAIEGVKNALSMTIPKGTGIHRRMVYLEIKDGYNFEKIAEAIKTDPYFIKDETYVIKVDDIDKLIDVGSGVTLVRKGVSGITHNQNFEFNMKINNPALTAQIMVASARAATKQAAGCYTMIEIPLIDFLYGERESIIKNLPV